MIKTAVFVSLALSASLAGSAYALADVDVVNNLSSTDKVTVNDQTVDSGSSKAMGLNIFNGDARVNVCDEHDNCKKFKVQDTHTSCSSNSWYYLVNPQSWYIDLYVNDQKIGHLCTVMHPNGWADSIVHMKLQFEKNDADGYSHKAYFQDMLGDEKEVFVW